eukprot:Selendium_serpulae@DN4137_c0_g1_i2.p1
MLILSSQGEVEWQQVQILVEAAKAETKDPAPVKKPPPKKIFVRGEKWKPTGFARTEVSAGTTGGTTDDLKAAAAQAVDSETQPQSTAQTRPPKHAATAKAVGMKMASSSAEIERAMTAK